MREIKAPKGKFRIFEAIREFPIDRFKDFQKYLVQDSGIGSTMSDVDSHYRNFDMFLSAGKLSECIQERHNLHYNLYFMLNRIDVKSVCFACLICSINDKEMNDFSETNLHAVSDEIGRMGFSRGELEDILSEVKKKLIANSK